jgi:hypothetical protein
VQKPRLISDLLGVAVEPTCFDLEHGRLDPAEIVRAIKGLGANTIRVGMFSHQGHAYYPSRIAPQAPFLRGRNLLTEFEAACRQQGVRLVVYLNSKWVTDLYRRHPDWVVRHRQGPYTFRDEDPHTRLVIYPMCPSSPFAEMFRGIVREVVETSSPDGIYIDNFGVVPYCRCRYCRERLGRKVPDRSAWREPETQAYLKWLVRENRRIAGTLVAAARSRHPRMPVIFNRGQFWSADDVFSPEDNRHYAHRIADAIHVESAVRFYGNSFGHINEQCAFGRSIGLPLWTWVEYGCYPFGYISCPGAETRIKAAKVLANGGRPMVWHLPFSPPASSTGMSGIREVFSLASRRRECFEDVTFAKFVGIVCSSNSVRAFCRGSRDRLKDYRETLAGACELALRNHMPFDFVLDEQITGKHLSAYRVLLLPNVVALTPTQCRALERFVEGGGSVFATFETSLYDRMGRRRRDFALRALFGSRYVRPLGEQLAGYCAGYARFLRPHPVNRNGLADGFFPVGGRYLAVASDDAIAALLRRCRYFCDFPQEPSGYPAIVARRYGKGAVVYVPGEFFTLYHRKAFPECGQFFRQCVEWFVGGRLPVLTDLPDTVEVTVARGRGGARIIHLINCTFDGTQPVEAIVPVAGKHLQLRSRRMFGRAADITTGKNVAFVQLSGSVRVKLPPLAGYNVIVLK